MKIAVFHNYMDNIGGSEIVSLILARELEADVYTTNVDRENVVRQGFGDVIPRIYSIGTVPGVAPLKRQATLWRFRHLDLCGRYDFYIVGGDWAVGACVHHKPNLWYVHSPLNELWQFRDHVREVMVPPWQRPAYDAWVELNRFLTRRYARHVRRWVCNSSNTADRVRRFYGAQATVVPPPVRLPGAVASGGAPGRYWLSVNRLFPNKRIDMQLEAFRRLPGEKLIVVGSYEKNVPAFEKCKAALEALRPPNVTFLHWVGDAELNALYAGAKGLVATARDEDFGMTPVEAMAAGKPVIAADEGGYRETIVPGVTGTLIPEIDGAKLASAIARMSGELERNHRAYRDACLKRAAGFGVEPFIRGIRGVIEETISAG